MPFARIIHATNTSATAPGKDAFVNTYYFNITAPPVGGPDWTALVNDFSALQETQSYNEGRFMDTRIYDMGDAEPRAPKARKVRTVSGSATTGVPQVAIALSYYADRNLPRQRGRVFLGPWTTGTIRPGAGQVTTALNLAQKLADLGGVNVDWSLWSPTTQTHTRINHAWVDDSWDIIRSRKIPATTRSSWTGDG